MNRSERWMLPWWTKLRAAALIVGIVLAWPDSGRAGITYQTGTIQGTLLTTAGQPFPSASVQAISSGGQGSLSASADASGNFTLTLVPTGTYQLSAYYQMFEVGTQAVTVVAGQTATAGFTFAGGTVQVTVEQDGSPVSGANVQLAEQVPLSCASPGCTPPDANGDCSCQAPGSKGPVFCNPTACISQDPGSTFDTATDATGFASVLVPALTFQVSVYGAQEPGQYGGIVVGQNSVVVTDQQTVFAGDYPYATGTVAGTVTEGGSPIANATVTALSTSTSGSAGASVTGGNYSLTLPVGSYQLSASLFAGAQVGSQPITVVAGSQTVDFAQPGGFISGSVVADGAAAAFANVQIAELAPLTCASPGCTPPDSNGDCSCQAPGKQGPVSCTPTACVYQDPGSQFGTATDATGSYSVFVPPGGYQVTVTSAPAPGQYGGIPVGVYTVTVADSIGASVGATSYTTGLVSGQVTSCGQPLTNVSVVVSTTGSPQGSVGGSVDTNGLYALRVPAGAYAVSAAWQMVAIAGGSPVEVNPGQTTPFSFNEDLGQLRGLVLRDGQPSTSSPVQISTEAVGFTCASAGCTPPDGSGNCSCQAPGKLGPVYCTAEGCIYQSPGDMFSANTGADGFFTTTVPPASYVVTAYSSQASGQSGGVAVGSVDVAVVACQLVEVGTSGATVTAGANVTVPLGDGVALTFAQVTDGSIGYTATSTPQGAPPPEDIQLAGLFYDITTTATFTGLVQICLPYDVDVTDPTQLQLLHNVADGDGGYSWVNITTSVDTVNHVVCGNTPGFSWFSVGVLRASPPLANAGSPFTVAADATCHATVTLDGSASAAGSSAIASYQWFNQGTLLGTGTSLQTTLGLGASVITLVVTDGDGAASSASVQVTVADETPPSFSVAEAPSTIWPPNGATIALSPTFTVSDNCDPSPSIALVGATCPTAAPGDIQIASNQQVSVRATRNGNEKNGRVYTETYRATDRSGNSTVASATVTVPHDQGKN